MSSFFDFINLNDFKLSKSDITPLNDRTILIKKWNWDYELAHKFQRTCLTLLDNSPKTRVLICCSHPRVFTNGRGLQKPRKGESLSLVEFDQMQAASLPFPLFQIERGGGLTFHHPGQMIIYPIVRLNPETLSLSSMMNELFDFATLALREWGLTDLSHENKHLGLWHKSQKLASMGIAIEKLTTFHGMALNFYEDQEMKRALQVVNPCGLKAETYTSVEELIQLDGRTLDDFANNFLGRFAHAWK